MRFARLIIFLSLFCDYALAADISFKHLTVDDGLPKSSVNHVLRDSDGFLWFGTTKGLCRYDGYEVKIYKSDPINENSLSSDKIKFISEDPRGGLWIGTQHGLNHFDKRTETFSRYYHSEADTTSLSNDIINFLFFDRDDRLWIGTDNGFSKYNPGQNNFERYYFEVPGQEGTAVVSIAQGEDNSLWFGMWRGGLYNYSISTNSLTHYLENFEQLTVQTIASHDGKLWLGTWKNGLLQFDPKTEEVGVFQSSNLVPLKPNVRAILIEPEREIAWIVNGQVLASVDLQNGELINLAHDPLNKYSLSKGIPNDLYLDDSGMLWIPNSDGVDYFDPEFSQFIRSFHDLSELKESNENIWIRHAVEDEIGNIWFCTFNNGLLKLNPAKQTIESFLHDPEQPSTISSNQVVHACLDPNGMIWLGTDQGLNVFDPGSGKVLRKYHEGSGAVGNISNFINYTFCDSKGNIWVGTLDGLKCIDLEKDSIISHLEGMSSFTVNHIFEDQYGVIWVSTTEGLAKYHEEESGFIPLSPVTRDSQSPSNPDCTFAYIDSNGKFWLGTRNDLFTLTREGDSYIIDKSPLSFPGNEVMNMVEKETGDLIFLSSLGISIVDTSATHIRSYGKLDGLDINYYCFLLSTEGTLYCAHDASGYYAFDPSEILINQFPPPVFITEFFINNQRISVREDMDKPSPLHQSILYADTLRLNSKQTSFSFEFAALNYFLPKKNSYAYILEGYDEDWNFTGSDRRFANYTKVDPGTYVFKVRAANHDNIWNEQGTEVMIFISPPFWRTAFAYSIYVIAFIVFLIISRQVSIKRAILKNNLEVEKISRENEKKLHQMRMQFFTNISHELKTPLTLILAPTQKLLHDYRLSDDLRKRIELINRNSKRLYNLISQILDFRKMETKNINLELQKTDLAAYVQLITSSFNELATEREITYTFITKQDVNTLWVDREKLEKILYNLLSNAFKYTPRKGSVTVILDKSEDSLSSWVRLDVVDSGIGIEKEHISSLFTPFQRIIPNRKSRFEENVTGTGLGLALSKSLVELHHGRIEVDSQVNEGSRFTVYLPLNDEGYEPGDFAADMDVDSEPLSLVNQFYMPQVFRDDFSHILPVDPEESKEEPESEKLNSILIVEDNPDMLHFIRDCLADRFEVYEAENGQEGLRKTSEYLPDLVISDVMMPGIGGLELTRRIKSEIKTCHIPIILLTAKSTIEEQKEGWVSGADAYVTKPFDAELLNIQIQKIIDTRSMIQEQFTKEFKVKPHDVTINSLDEIFLDKLVTIIENKLADEDFSISYLSSEIGISKTHLYRKLKALTGYTTTEFIRTIKIKKAAQYIEAGYNIAETMLMVGISSRPYFIKCFRDIFGTTPSEYHNLKKSSMDSSSGNS